jgi:hypothetical protein
MKNALRLLLCVRRRFGSPHAELLARRRQQHLACSYLTTLAVRGGLGASRGK